MTYVHVSSSIPPQRRPPASSVHFDLSGGLLVGGGDLSRLLLGLVDRGQLLGREVGREDEAGLLLDEDERGDEGRKDHDERDDHEAVLRRHGAAEEEDKAPADRADVAARADNARDRASGRGLDVGHDAESGTLGGLWRVA